MTGREQRIRNRVRLDLAVRIRQIGPPRNLIEVSRTLDVSRNGLLFRTREPYDLRGTVWVTMPYNPDSIVPESEFPATVVRVNRNPDGTSDVAVQFHNPRSDQVAASYQPAPRPETRDRRNRSRVRMSLPILVRHENRAEESITVDVSRAGVLFQTAHHYPVGQTVWVTMPYQPGGRQDEVPARVVRVVERTNLRGVALHFGSATSGITYARSF